MKKETVVGTVRGSRNGRHVVVRRDGTTVDVRFDGPASPLIGGDVIGVVRYDEFGEARMKLERSVFDLLLDGERTRIFPMGMRPDLTARILAKVLSRSKSAVMAPGRGMSIERAPVSEDADLAWAMAAFQPEAERLSVALNVIDVQAVARADWQPSVLRDLTLPADVEGSRRAMADLSRLLRSGFHPDCNRMIEMHTGNRDISVNFVLPYSPFAGALGFARETACMDAGAFPSVSMDVHEARRLSSAHHVALALAHNRLGAGQGSQADVDAAPRAAHMAACFADAAATLTFLASGGRPDAVAEYADLREASLRFGYVPGTGELRDGVLAKATHRAVRAALQARVPEGAGAKEIVTAATRIARRVALPASRFLPGADVPTEEEALSAAAAASRVSFDLRHAAASDREVMERRYRDDFGFLVDEHSGDQAAAARLAVFATVHVPLGMRHVFDGESSRLPEREPAGPSVPSLKDRDLLARRIRSARDDDAIEFGEVLEEAHPSPAP